MNPLPSDLPPLRDVISSYGLRARRGLGQHFLLDLNLTSRIVKAAGDLTGVTVIEVGPGPGGLTRALLDSCAARVIAIERDERCVEALSDLSNRHPNRLEIISGDALKITPRALGPAPRKIIANLPYNIAIPLLIGWLKDVAAIDGMVLMFQKEVADRLTAVPRTKSYGRLAIMAQWQCEVQTLFNIDKRAFTPSPKVTSSVVSFTLRSKPLAPAEWNFLEKVTAAAFGQRRKMLRTSLKSLNLDLAAAGVNPTARAEELDTATFCRLARLAAESSGT
jgi:16S rRNA (adenine1518-N6/adenine1519-N6)-dimethyltransferase